MVAPQDGLGNTDSKSQSTNRPEDPWPAGFALLNPWRCLTVGFRWRNQPFRQCVELGHLRGTGHVQRDRQLNYKDLPVFVKQKSIVVESRSNSLRNLTASVALYHCLKSVVACAVQGCERRNYSRSFEAALLAADSAQTHELSGLFIVQADQARIRQKNPAHLSYG